MTIIHVKHNVAYTVIQIEQNFATKNLHQGFVIELLALFKESLQPWFKAILILPNSVTLMRFRHSLFAFCKNTIPATFKYDKQPKCSITFPNMHGWQCSNEKVLRVLRQTTNIYKGHEHKQSILQNTLITSSSELVLCLF